MQLFFLPEVNFTPLIMAAKLWGSHFSQETPKRVIGKQRSTECDVWLGSPQFANRLAIFCRNIQIT